MNKNLLFATAASALLACSGCAVNHETLAKYGDYKLEGDNLKSFTVESLGSPEPEKLLACVASTVHNDSVTLSDSAGSFVGAYTGNYYNSGSSRETGGGSVIQYVSKDNRDIVARGSTMYTAGIIQRAVRFGLRITDDGSLRTYQFSRIEQAQTETGTIQNTGFMPVHARPGGGAGHVLQSLKTLAAEVDACTS